MLNSHAAVGVAQTIFYAPILVAAANLRWRRHDRPLMAWICLLMFSLVRVVGGIALALYENDPSSVVLIILSIILEGAGVIPLMLALVGLLRIIKATDFRDSKVFKYCIIALRGIFLVGIGLVIAGAALLGNYDDPSLVSTGSALAKSGYAVLAAVLAIIVGFAGYLWVRASSLCSTSVRVLQGVSLSIPFLGVRLAYACLSVYSTDPLWNPLNGSVPALVCMHSLMEYIVVLICVGVGYTIPRTKACGRRDKNSKFGNFEEA